MVQEHVTNMAPTSNIALAILTLIQAFLCGVAIDNKATLEIRMYSFRNPEERDYHGGSCDPFGIGACDHTFVFCVDDVRQSDYAVENCEYYRQQTSKWQNQNNIKFDHDMHGVSNPIMVPFPHGWPGRVDFKVGVQDRDDGIHYPHDSVDFIKKVIEGRPAVSKNDADWKVVHIRGTRSTAPTSLVFYYMVYCQPDYYGENCDVFCQPQNSTEKGHYTCDPDTGEKLCLPGWEAPLLSCSILQENCWNHHCLNKGVCVDHYMGYTCSCLPGYTGVICEENIDECAPAPCQNGGTCVDGVNGYTCTCASGFAGENCTSDVCSDPSRKQCQNGGTCTIVSGVASCTCPPGYIGGLCDISRCDILNCRHGSTCNITQGTCDCPEGYFGDGCGTSICEIIPCHNGGVCRGSRCECPDGFQGKFCETIVAEVNECLGDPCRNNGSCFDQIQGYYCKCSPGFTGDNCDRRLPAPKLPPGDPAIDPDGDTVKDPDGVGKPRASSQSEDQGGLQGWMWAIIGVGIGLLLALIIILVLVTAYRRKRRQLKQAQQQTDIFHVNPSFQTESVQTENNHNNSRSENVYANPGEPQYVNRDPQGARGFADVVPTVGARTDKKSLHVELPKDGAPPLPPKNNRDPSALYARPHSRAQGAVGGRDTSATSATSASLDNDINAIKDPKSDNYKKLIAQTSLDLDKSNLKSKNYVNMAEDYEFVEPVKK